MNSFERKLEILRQKEAISIELINAVIYVHDGLEISAMIAESIFGESVTHGDVFAIYKFIAEKHISLSTMNDQKTDLNEFF